MQIEEKFGSEIIKNPEIIIGLVGPIGIELETVQECVIKELETLGYNTEFIKITDLMRRWEIGLSPVSNASFSEYYQSLIRYADEFRAFCESHSALAALAIQEIRNRRVKLHRQNGEIEEADNQSLRNQAVLGTAYVIRQFKLPQEIELMRRIYGRKFIQISVFMDKSERKKSLVSKIRGFNTANVTTENAEIQALELIKTDANEEKEKYGQRVAEVFHLGDVFVLGSEKQKIESTIKRFLAAFFGSNEISPSKIEYGMYAAAGAALRSVDLSRQVGAAIFSESGEIKVLGCNEVPKAFGGTYWGDGTENPQRDIERGNDANHDRKVEILHDFMIRLADLKLLSTTDHSEKNFDRDIQSLVQHPVIRKSQLMDIIEFGRMVHAEMCAICDAARLGINIENSVLFCTTFPCHMCAKHIVASGIKRVVFLEPYPKSYAEDLHSDSITFDPNEKHKKVLFEPFIGISPRRYRDIFEKGKRKTLNGKKMDWSEGSAVPRIEDRSAAYIENESSAAVEGGLNRLPDPNA